MAQVVGGTGSNEGEEQVEFDLRVHLSKYNVSDKIFDLLQQDSITANELSIFRIKDLNNWCDENHLKTIERTRFISAVKSLPNSQSNAKDDYHEPIIVPVLIGNEEKEQLSQFDAMKNNTQSMIDHINELQIKFRVDKVIQEINHVCDEIQSHVETLRKNLLNQVKSMQVTQSQNLSSSNTSFENLLKLIENTNDTYTKYLASINNNNKQQPIFTKDEIVEKISKCEQEYDEIVLNNLKIVSQNNNIVSLNYNMNEIKQIIQSKLIATETSTHESEFVDKLSKIKFSHKKDDVPSYSICQFDLKYTKLSKESTIDCDNKHIKIGSSCVHCYAMIMPDKEHAQGYKSGRHCFRMYYKNPKGANQWLLFGIYKYGIVPEDVYTHLHGTSWGIADNEIGSIYCNGKEENDKPNMSFLYSSDENQIDMLIDFDKGTLSYSIVINDTKKKGNKYTFKKKFKTNLVSFLRQIGYTVHLHFLWPGTEVQIAKIDVDMFGKNKRLVQWPIENY